MRRWLLTVDPSVDPAALRMRLARLSIDAVVADEAVPLGEGEQVLSVASEIDLVDRLAGDEVVRSVHPDSDMTLYDGGLGPVF